VLQKVDRVEIDEMAAIFRGIVREEVEWENDSDWDYDVPTKVEGVDLERFRPERFYDQEQTEKFVRELRAERIEYLESFKGLHPDIVNAVKR
jgi:phosphoenolpyruvate carboxykinase (ATP)